MTRFEAELKNNNFVCSECVKCKHLVWPPSNYCNKCFGDVIWRPVSKKATLVEFSSKDGKNFCIGEFENSIRVFGMLEKNSNLIIGQNMTLKYCDFDQMPKFVFQTD
ncbi:MAG: hypothetical protein WA833_07875 [Nitrosotalea sp.]